jgi:hypothetical protein
MAGSWMKRETPVIDRECRIGKQRLFYECASIEFDDARNPIHHRHP